MELMGGTFVSQLDESLNTKCLVHILPPKQKFHSILIIVMH